MFIHAGWLHILGNMIYLWVFGDNVENSMGHLRYLIFYLLCGLGANALEIATSVNSTVPGLGASGAIAGVLAAYLVLYPKSRVGTLIPIAIIFIPVRLPAWVLIGFWFALQLLDGIVSLSNTAAGGVAYWAHVGGFITGVILVWIFRKPERVGNMRAYHYGGSYGS
jgi:membrane associated rhomboid family serine protease